jgi:hypothetical protein
MTKGTSSGSVTRHACPMNTDFETVMGADEKIWMCGGKAGDDMGSEEYEGKCVGAGGIDKWFGADGLDDCFKVVVAPP